MKFKRAVKTVMCGMALMGMLSMEALPVQAAACSHKFWSSIIDADKGYCYKEDGHYKEHGVLYICADCGEERWEDLKEEWFEDHDFSIPIDMYPTENGYVFRNGCSTPDCPYVRTLTFE